MMFGDNALASLVSQPWNIAHFKCYFGEKHILKNMYGEQGGAAAAAEVQALYILGKHFIVEP